jgi:hypothetical protein
MLFHVAFYAFHLDEGDAEDDCELASPSTSVQGLHSQATSSQLLLPGADSDEVAGVALSTGITNEASKDQSNPQKDDDELDRGGNGDHDKNRARNDDDSQADACSTSVLDLTEEEVENGRIGLTILHYYYYGNIVVVMTCYSMYYHRLFLPASIDTY